MPSDLLDALEEPSPSRQVLADGAVLLRGFVRNLEDELLAEIERIAASAPFRQMVTRSGHTMSVTMTSCGPLGWVSDRRGYRYVPDDPDTSKPWPAMPNSFRQLATTAAAQAGFDGFVPDACLINRYEPGTRLSLHQDRDEQHLDAPIVSVSLGLPATFLFGGLHRTDPTQRVRLVSGDVVAWGGPARLAFHGVLPLPEGKHPLTGRCRINLTFRQAG
ncbi:MAG: DNA oxidative demethylase AlkB [Janthinobacterium lividum]